MSRGKLAVLSRWLVCLRAGHSARWTYGEDVALTGGIGYHEGYRFSRREGLLGKVRLECLAAAEHHRPRGVA